VQSGRCDLRCGLGPQSCSAWCAAIASPGCTQSADGPSVESVEPRRNLIERIDARGRAEPVAANIDRLAIVVAPEPAPDWFLVDRYWAGAALKDLDALLIVNKSDLGTARSAAADEYRNLQLPCIEVACRSGAGIAELKSLFAAK
jgi:ribosome biogenesis GTPase